MELCGFYQTQLFADFLGPDLRRLLVFKPNIRHEAAHFIANARPTDWAPGSYVLVGVHVRRGDFARSEWRETGVTMVDERYLHLAVEFFTGRYRRVGFIVATDDIHWTRAVLMKIISKYLHYDIVTVPGILTFW